MEKLKPFSNGTDAMIWVDLNCNYCTYAPYCYAKKQIELGFITGEITLKQGEWIGMSDNRLKSICDKKNTPKPKEKKKPIKDDNLKLF